MKLKKIIAWIGLYNVTSAFIFWAFHGGASDGATLTGVVLSSYGYAALLILLVLAADWCIEVITG